jgi:hypothetical protein
MKNNKESVLSVSKQQIMRKSMVSLSPSQVKGNKHHYDKKTLKSFDITPFKTTNSYYMSNATRSSNTRFEQTPIVVQKLDEFKDDKDASELKEFIEVEDFCRRTTVADSKLS